MKKNNLDITISSSIILITLAMILFGLSKSGLALDISDRSLKENIVDATSKLNDVTADLKLIKNSAMAGGKVHSGFQDEVNDLWMDILKELEHNSNLKIQKDVYMCGHSLGAAMATIAATRHQPVELFTFGSPRVGGPKFIKNIKCPHLRFQNNNDIVTRIPPAWLGFRHHGNMIYFNRFGDRQLKPTWKDLFFGIANSWKKFKFFDGIVDHVMPNYVKAITKLSKVK